MKENEPPALRVFLNSEIVFTSNGKWLHPLFELEDFLRQSGLRPEELYLEDKIIGRGAAFLIVFLRIQRIHARLLSELGREVFQSFKVTHTWDELVPAIACKTEEILRNVGDPKEAYELLKARAARPV